jgi:hypothetical protein
MKQNLRKILLLLPLVFLSGCGKNSAKVITIDEGMSLISSALTKDVPNLLQGTSYTFRSTIQAPDNLQSDLPYLSLSVVYSNAITYLTNIERKTSGGTDTYAVTKTTDSVSGQTVYYIATNGDSPLSYDPVKDAYLYNFFDLPNYLLNENIYALNATKGLLASVSTGTENKLTSYNLSSKGGGSLDLTLRGHSLDFTALFTETPQINANVESLHFVMENYLLTSLDATYLVSPSSTTLAKHDQVAPTSSKEGSLCTFKMDLIYS